MEIQHEVLGDSLARATELADIWVAGAQAAARARLADTLTGVSTVLDEHLGDEEQLILPLASRQLAQAEWDRLAERARRSERPGRKALLVLGRSSKMPTRLSASTSSGPFHVRYACCGA